MADALFDVLAVDLKTYKVRFMAQAKTKPNAVAIAEMAVIRRGCDEEIYVEVPAGLYAEGDKHGTKEATDGAA